MRQAKWWKLIAVASLVFSTMPTHWAAGHEPRSTGLNELVIYDSETTQSGRAGIEFDDGKVRMRPMVHVHRNYYTGNKEFQGPFVAGGPTLIVANHPKTGEKTYIETNLPAGYPVIAYDKHSIRYIFREQRVFIKFGHHDDSATIAYIEGETKTRQLGRDAKEFAASVRTATQQSATAGALGRIAQGGGNLCKGTGRLVDQAAGNALDFSVQILSALPGLSALNAAGQERTQTAYLNSTRNAEDRNSRFDFRNRQTNR